MFLTINNQYAHLFHGQKSGLFAEAIILLKVDNTHTIVEFLQKGKVQVDTKHLDWVVAKHIKHNKGLTHSPLAIRLTFSFHSLVHSQIVRRRLRQGLSPALLRVETSSSRLLETMLKVKE